VHDDRDMTDDDDGRPLKKSKQQQKREAEAAQQVGREMVELSQTHFKALIKRLDLPEDLYQALQAARSIKSHEAHRRQLQYIGKLMRGIETTPIEQALAQLRQGGQQVRVQQHLLEHWRERLLQEGEGALNELLRLQPQADAARLRQWIAQARREAAEHQPPRAARQLFRYLRDSLSI